MPLWLPLPSSLELERVDIMCCKRPALFFKLPESAAKCLGKTGSLVDGVWKIETGREKNMKLDDERGDVYQADKASIRSLGRHTTEN